MRLVLLALLVNGSACATARVPAATPSLPLPAPGPVVPPREEPECDRWLVLEGRANVAGNWGPGGSFVGCHVGPGPKDELRAELGREPLRRCLVQSGVTRLEATVRVGGDGQVSAIDLAELEPSSAPVSACLRHLEGTRFQALRCRWSGELRFVALGGDGRDEGP
jgi:hypothetical protein